MITDKITTMGQLRTALLQQVSLSGTVAQAAADAVEEALELTKMDKPTATAVTLPTSGWASTDDLTADDEDQAEIYTEYRYYYDIRISGVTAADRVGITIALGSTEAAKECGLAPTNESMADTVRVYAMSAPTKEITGEYWIEKGVT